jgi:hypothetical protein
MRGSKKEFFDKFTKIPMLQFTALANPHLTHGICLAAANAKSAGAKVRF